MARNLKDYTYTPSSLTRPAVKRTPYDQTRIAPMTGSHTGKLGGLGAKVSGGTMNSGGKTRPSGSRIRRGNLN